DVEQRYSRTSQAELSIRAHREQPADVVDQDVNPVGQPARQRAGVYAGEWSVVRLASGRLCEGGHEPDFPRNTAALRAANSANVVGRTPNRSCVWRRTADSAPLRRSLNSSSRASAK